MDPTKVAWFSKEGHFNVGNLSIDAVLRQAVGDNEEQFRSATRVLESMCHHGRKDAGVFLLGLLLTCEDKWEKRIAVVDALKGVETQACVDLLFQELKRVKSSNTTRRYLTEIIKVLAAMPAELVLSGFSSMASDKTFSPKMRDKFKAILHRATMSDNDPY